MHSIVWMKVLLQNCTCFCANIVIIQILIRCVQFCTAYAPVPDAACAKLALLVDRAAGYIDARKASLLYLTQAGLQCCTQSLGSSKLLLCKNATGAFYFSTVRQQPTVLRGLPTIHSQDAGTAYCGGLSPDFVYFGAQGAPHSGNVPKFRRKGFPVRTKYSA